MFRIWKEFHFEAAHHLTGLPEGHPCSQHHGHSYRVELELSAPELTGPGFVADYGELKSFGNYLDQVFDHQDLNKRLRINPTAENIAKLLYDSARLSASWGHLVTAVRVYETAKTGAEYRPDPPGSAPTTDVNQ